MGRIIANYWVYVGTTGWIVAAISEVEKLGRSRIFRVEGMRGR